MEDVDYLNYGYDGNRLTYVEETASQTAGFKQNTAIVSNAYAYDDDGNLIEDKNKGLAILYNHLGLVSKITWRHLTTNAVLGSIDYLYDAGGTMLQKVLTPASGVGTKIDYVGSFYYQNDALQFFQHEEGRVLKTTSGLLYEYSLTDHQGNTRINFVDRNGDQIPEVVQESHYYPSGMPWGTNWTDPLVVTDLFGMQGKEWMTEGFGGTPLAWYDFGARMYDPVTLRWWAQDPAFQTNSPYSYCGNDPINHSDPDGRFFGLDDAAVALIGGTINLVSNIASGGFSSNPLTAFIQGVNYFAVGAIGGVMALDGGPIGIFAAGSFVGGMNAAIAGKSYSDVFKQGAIGGATSLVGFGVGKGINSALGDGIGNGWRYLIVGGGAGFAAGFTGGISAGIAYGQDAITSLHMGFQNGLIGLVVGAGMSWGIGKYGDYKAWKAMQNQTKLNSVETKKIEIQAERNNRITIGEPAAQANAQPSKSKMPTVRLDVDDIPNAVYTDASGNVISSGAAKTGVQAAEYTFTKSAGKHLTEVVTKGANKGQLSRPYMNSPLTIQEIMSTGKGSIDATFKGGMNWKVPGTFRGSQGIWELGINPKTNVIYHFNFVK